MTRPRGADRQCGSGEGEFYRQFQAHYPGVFAYFYSQTGEVRRAKELTAELFARAGVIRQQWDRVMLFRLARRLLAAEQLCRAFGGGPGRRLGAPAGPFGNAGASLPADQVELLSLRFDAGLPYAEIALATGTDEASTRAGVLAALVELRRRLQGAGDEGHRLGALTRGGDV